MLTETRSGEWSPGLTAEAQETLFQIARDTLEWCVDARQGSFLFEDYVLAEALRKRMATFVTLKAGEQLRGCIGSLSPLAALFESVHDNAVNAALHDSRFRPIRREEVAGLSIHVSLLSPIVLLESIDGFKLGEHGIIIEKGRQCAVYLPEVAREQNWTREETLVSLSQKAGLPPDAWESGAQFRVFSSVVLAESL